jgi:hypothetical protein
VHTDIVGTTFWVGEIFDPTAEDGSQVFSTYDSNWLENYGGCDGTTVGGRCETEARSAENDYFPSRFTPLENPFYLDLPFDDVNDPGAFARRDEVVPWAGEEPYASHKGDRDFSYLKNRWVALSYDGEICYAQIEDAGPGEYDDAGYVFGSDDARPLNARYGGAGMDVSPAVVGCLGFDELNGEQSGISWRFVDDADVPPGPWTRVVTTSQVQ